MARRIYMIDGYAHTYEMACANITCHDTCGRSLRAYLLGWRAEHPSASFLELAGEFGIHHATLYRWFDRLEIAPGGPILRDLAAERANRQSAATGTDG